jgi:hypothetical protein
LEVDFKTIIRPQHINANNVNKCRWCDGIVRDDLKASRLNNQLAIVNAINLGKTSLDFSIEWFVKKSLQSWFIIKNCKNINKQKKQDEKYQWKIEKLCIGW